MSDIDVPFTERLKAVPGFFGIRLEEQPRYEVVGRVDDVEIRKYAPATLAEVHVTGSHDDALDQAFERLAKYIFGDNMPAKPSTLARRSAEKNDGKGEEMAMTNPVSKRPDGDGWTVSFFLGNDLSAGEAPQPTDPGIRLVEAPARLVAATSYGGNDSAEKRKDAKAELFRALRELPAYRPAAKVSWAQFDAPFVLPFVKKNEAQVEIEKAEIEKAT